MADRLIETMTKSAARQYGQERVDELAHALQCAELADAAGADEELVLACLLHDVGRYAVAQEGISDTLERITARPVTGRGHHDAGADLVAPYVSERVAFLIRAHAEAKRYLCTTQPGYWDLLSPGSKHTLTLQGTTRWNGRRDRRGGPRRYASGSGTTRPRWWGGPPVSLPPGSRCCGSPSAGR